MRGPVEALLAAVAKAVHDVALALPHAFHVDADGSGVHAIAGAPPRQRRHARAGDHGFRRRATLVHAGSAHMLAFDQCGSNPGLRERPAQRRSPLAGADDDRVVSIGLIHRKRSFAWDAWTSSRPPE